MKAALVVNRVLPDIDVNLVTILSMATEAADAGAELVLFPEAALTGLINNDDPSHDLRLGRTIPGLITDVLGELTRERCIWLAIGILERENGKLYDSAVLLTPDGEIGLKYWRITPQWHGRTADPSIYRQGTKLFKLETPRGTFSFLICGDLFDDKLIQRARNLRPDYLLFPFARGFDEECPCEGWWDGEEKLTYMQRAKLIGCVTLMTNYFADKNLLGGGFGGAMVVSSDGTLIDSFPLGKTGMLLVNV